MVIDAKGMHFKTLNEKVRECKETKIKIKNCIGQRYIASGLDGKTIEIDGIPGNALGSYLNGCTLKINGNAQDATGDTMNSGVIAVAGSGGDATGYAMRGGKIFIKGNVGYRAGIHMKQYKEKKPIIVIGGKAGCFLGEYQAGGLIIVLGIGCEKPVGNFCATGMHGGKIVIRGDFVPENLPANICVSDATDSDMDEIAPEIREFCSLFGYDDKKLLSGGFKILTPDTKNPYKRLYTPN